MATKIDKSDKSEKSDRGSRRQTPKTNRQQSNRVVNYFRETRGELRKVTWPTWEETWRLSLIVVGVSIVTAIFLGLILDSMFSASIRGVINLLFGV